MSKNQNQAATLEEKVQLAIAAAAPAFDLLPGVIIIHNIKNWKVVHMSQLGLRQLNMSIEQLTSLEGAAYYAKFFNEDDAKDYVPKILGLLERNNNEEITSFFQQVKFFNDDTWHWHVSAVKIFMRDEEEKPHLTITYAMRIDPKHHFTEKVERLLGENNFIRANHGLFSSLTKREKQILAFMAQGASAADIGERLFISEKTATTHRRNIKSKLGIQNNYDIVQFAQAYNLV